MATTRFRDLKDVGNAYLISLIDVLMRMIRT